MSIAWPTTSAPSRPRPSSGSDLSHAVAPAAGVCTNCGAAVATPYCGACGQRDLPHNPSARVLVGELWDTFGTIDGKLVRTVSLLMTRPGALTVEWLRGKRAPYLRPLNLYLTVSAAYFTAAATTFRPEEFVRRSSPDALRAAATLSGRLERKFADAPPLKRTFALGFARLATDPAAGMRLAMAGAPRIMFVLVPLFALLVGRTVRGRGWRYPAHLYFALHGFAFYFAVSLVQRAAHVYGPAWLGTLVGWAVGLGTLAYLAIAMRRVYGGRWSATLVRAAAVGIPFYLAFTVAIVVDAVVMLGLR